MTTKVNLRVRSTLRPQVNQDHAIEYVETSLRKLKSLVSIESELSVVEAPIVVSTLHMESSDPNERYESEISNNLLQSGLVTQVMISRLQADGSEILDD